MWCRRRHHCRSRRERAVMRETQVDTYSTYNGLGGGVDARRAPLALPRLLGLLVLCADDAVAAPAPGDAGAGVLPRAPLGEPAAATPPRAAAGGGGAAAPPAAAAAPAAAAVPAGPPPPRLAASPFCEGFRVSPPPAGVFLSGGDGEVAPMWRTRHGQRAGRRRVELGLVRVGGENRNLEKKTLEFSVCVCVCVWRGNIWATDFGATPTQHAGASSAPHSRAVQHWSLYELYE